VFSNRGGAIKMDKMEYRNCIYINYSSTFLLIA
jgi:hypothetical protein